MYIRFIWFLPWKFSFWKCFCLALKLRLTILHQKPVHVGLLQLHLLDAQNLGDVDIYLRHLVFQMQDAVRKDLGIWSQNLLQSYCGKSGFLRNWQMHIRAGISSTNLCSDINCWCHLFSSLKLILKANRWVMEGSMIFCQKNILEHSLSFYRDYKKRCLLTTRVSQIL